MKIDIYFKTYINNIGVESMDKFEPRTDKNKYNELVKNTHFVFIPYIFQTQQEDVIKFCQQFLNLLKRIDLTIVWTLRGEIKN